jgi:aryl-alcohol dehydrogenase-like predicted oxidoreductase
MHYADFISLGKSTSQIGFGCGRLVGRSSLAQSARVVETALDLGIRYFDVAPSYGMGTAEEVIGEVIGTSTEVTIATKIGVPRPQYSAKGNLVRRVVRPLLSQQQSLYILTRRLYALSRRSKGRRARFDFTTAAIRASLEDSLERLRRESVDVFLVHEPDRSDLCDEVEDHFRSLVSERLISAYGAGVGARGDRWSPFGSIWQSGWPGGSARQYHDDVSYIFHGVVRFAPARPSGATAVRVSSLVRTALEQAPNCVLLVSASTPARLRELLQEV